MRMAANSGNFVNIHDVVDANLLALTNSQMDGNVFNVGWQAYTIKQFADIVHDGYSTITCSPCQRRLFPPPIATAIRAMPVPISAKSIGWTPRYSPADSVREYVDWLYAQDNVEDILEYAEQTMKKLDVVRKSA